MKRRSDRRRSRASRLDAERTRQRVLPSRVSDERDAVVPGQGTCRRGERIETNRSRPPRGRGSARRPRCAFDEVRASVRHVAAHALGEVQIQGGCVGAAGDVVARAIFATQVKRECRNRKAGASPLKDLRTCVVADHDEVVASVANRRSGGLAARIRRRGTVRDGVSARGRQESTCSREKGETDHAEGRYAKCVGRPQSVAARVARSGARPRAVAFADRRRIRGA